jgi:hypothetical protein
MPPSIASDVVPAPPMVLELLAWVDARPRTYRETMEAWRTSCPRFPVWEDATSAGLVEVAAGAGPGGDGVVRLTTGGRAVLARAQQQMR